MIIPILYFNTVNPIKIREIKEIFYDKKFELKFLNNPIIEILSDNVREVILSKASEAYKRCRVPVIVEHGALCIDYFNGFPGALSKPMWDLMGDNICKLIPSGEIRSATAYSAVCYCDGRSRATVIGETKGVIAYEGIGNNGFQWDPIFIPEGQLNTYAQMNQTEKLFYSQATRAYDKLVKLLEFPNI